MNYYVCGHQHKGRPYAKALREAGHHLSPDNPDVALFDRDWYMHNNQKPRGIVSDYIRKGAAIMIYPHSPLPPWWYDGLVPLQEHVRCVFVIGEAQKLAMQIIAPWAKVKTTGWAWCQQREFQPPQEVKHILFAPIHPSGHALRPEALEANRRIYNDLKDISCTTDIQVTVRYMGDLRIQGLHKFHRFEWIQGMPDGSTQEIDNADVVIAEGTFMYMAVARGKPVIGINQHLPARANKNADIFTPRNWEQYGPELAYPINYGEAGALEAAGKDNVFEQGKVKEWQARMRMFVKETGIYRQREREQI